MAVGLGISSPAATDYIVGALPVSRAGMASGVNQCTRQLGSALGIAVMGTFMNSTYREKISEIQVLSSLPQDIGDAVSRSIQTAHITAGYLPGDVAGIINDGANSAFVLGMNNAMFIGAFIIGGTALFALIFLPRHVQRHD